MALIPQAAEAEARGGTSRPGSGCCC
jgi:hypothetical protein